MPRPRASRRDDGQLLALAGFLLGIALLTVTASVSLVDSTEHAAVRSGAGGVTTLEEFKTARARLLDFFESRASSVDASVLENDLRIYMANSYGGRSARASEINVTLAKSGTLDGQGLAADEGTFIAAGKYTVTSHDGISFTAVDDDGANDGMIMQNDAMLGAILRLELRTPTERVVEIVVVALQG